MSQSERRTLRFDPFHLPPDVELLYRGGEVVPLEPRAVRVLRYLAERHDRVVPKEELLEQVWPDVFTTDGVLKKAVSQVRRALGDDAGNARYVETYHARGYRFVAPVTFASAAAEAAPEDSDAQATPSAQAPAHSMSARHAEATTARAILPLAGAGRGEAADPDYDQLIGREAELTALAAEYRGALKGAGRPVLVTGEPGIGKTQLARYFTRWAAAQGALCLYARFFDYGGSRLAPYETFLDLLRSAFGLAGGAHEPRGDEDAARALRAAAEARCGVRLPEELFGDAHELAAAPPHVQTGGGTTGDRFRAVVPISRCFVQLCRERPVVLVLDDLQWADEASRDVVGYLMRTAHSEPLLIVALARAEETTRPDHALAGWLKQEAGYRSYTSVALKPLDEDACRLAVEAVFGGGATSPRLARNDLRTLCRVTGGNPYFLVETLRLLVAEGAIRHAAGGDAPGRWGWQGLSDLRLPDTIATAARAKLDRLPAGVREVVEHAAVIGDEFRVETLALMAGRGEGEVEESLREGVRLGVLSERGLSAGEDCRFHHTTLRRVVYEDLPPRRRRRLHERAARAIESAHAREADRFAEALSTHWEAAGDLRRAFAWGMRAWAAASSRWHWGEAVAHVERARRAAAELEGAGQEGLPEAERLRLLLALGEGHFSVGRLKESDAVLAEAATLAAAAGDMAALAAALLLQGQTRNSFSMYHEAGAPTRQALDIYKQLDDHAGMASALLQLGSVQFALGNYEAACELIERALTLVGEETYVAAVAFGKLGWARVLQGRFDVGVPLLERALRFHTRAGDVRQRAVLLRCLNSAQYGTGDYEEAIRTAERAREEARSIGDDLGETKAEFRVGQARVAQGLYPEGVAVLEHALARVRVSGDAHCEAEILWLLGRAAAEQGQGAEAGARLARALEMIRQIGDRDDEFRILTDLARLRVDERDYRAGLRLSEQAAVVAAELKNGAGLGAALVEEARARLGLKHPRRAREAARRAVKLLEDFHSGERWRGQWVLGLCPDDADAPDEGAQQPTSPDGDCALAHLRRAVALLDEMRGQLDPSDAERHAALTRARSAPARDLHAALLRAGLAAEARAVARNWLLQEPSGGASQLRLVSPPPRG